MQVKTDDYIMKCVPGWIVTNFFNKKIRIVKYT